MARRLADKPPADPLLSTLLCVALYQIAHTRAMINAALSGALATVPVQRDPIFNLDVPTACPGVPADVLNPRNTWQDKNAYDQMAKKLAAMFVENFKTFEATAAPAVKASGPKA